ncbi:hypothetical protein CC80DRAFT_497020 [Byssothecium circinans]|uniref:DUF6594 domain-containing protein n=1 Tax=Byssothecium circinans TaxID=147558 RepID=A0A6A5TCI4_9PLEO|nr:hypothetical protein CC80DRAFT_497020 [Byssothecium circinans]
MNRDVENDTIGVTFIKGYPSLAEFIASDYDHSTFVFKRFGRLSARNLLYLQSELAELEALQDEYDREDSKASLDEKSSRRDGKMFQARARDVNFPRDQKRMELVKDIRAKIKEYEEAILLNSAFLSMRRPSRQVHEAFYNYFWNKSDTKPDFPSLLGNSSTVYNDRDDLVALVRPAEEDRLSAFLRKHCSILFLTNRKSQKGRIAYISAHRITVVVGTFNIILAAVFLFGAIMNLYYVVNEKKRLGLIAGYTVAFALCVGLLTNARRSEIFGASAAYAAVLVVFVSGNLGG